MAPSWKLTPHAIAGATFALIGACRPEAAEPTGATESSLKQDEHVRITEAICQGATIPGSNLDEALASANLPAAFCRRVANANQNVDVREWESLDAHSMRNTGQSACDAAAAVVARLQSKGREVAAGLRSTSVDAAVVNQIADSLGQALHAIGDNCAHHGMSNPDHAWHTMTNDDPDTKQAAKTCTMEETAKIFRAFAQAMQSRGFDKAKLSQASSLTAERVPFSQLCAFVRESSQWDGVDSRWDNSVTVPAFRSALTSAFGAGGEAPVELCTGGDLAIQSPNPTITPRPLGGLINWYCRRGGGSGTSPQNLDPADESGFDSEEGSPSSETGTEPPSEDPAELDGGTSSSPDESVDPAAVASIDDHHC